jgi:hypothetical protein
MKEEITSEVVKFIDALHIKYGVVSESKLYSFLRSRVPSHEVKDYINHLTTTEQLKEIQPDLPFMAVPESNN